MIVNFGGDWRLVRLKVKGDGDDRKRVEAADGDPCIRGAIDGNPDYASSGVVGVKCVVLVTASGKELVVPASPDKRDVAAFLELLGFLIVPRPEPVAEQVEAPPDPEAAGQSDPSGVEVEPTGGGATGTALGDEVQIGKLLDHDPDQGPQTPPMGNPITPPGGTVLSEEPPATEPPATE